MGNPFIVVEAEEKAKTIHQQYGAGAEILVVASAPVKAVAVPPMDELRREALHFRFEPIPSQQEIIDNLLAAQGKEIYLALDGDQRGEYWAWLISEFMQTATQGRQLPKRLHLTGLCEEELHESFRLVETIEREKATAHYVRMLFDSHLARHLQRLIGTPSGPENLPLGFYSLTTLFLLAERETEIRMYTPVEKWQVSATLATEQGSFEARLVEAYGISDDGVLRDAEEARKVVEMFRDKTFVVAEVERTPVEIHPPAPYQLAQLLNDAHVAWSFGPKQVFAAVQKLFYGVELRGKHTSLISSHLPVAGNAPMAALVDRIKAHIKAVYGEGAVRPAGEGVDLAGGILPVHPGLKSEDLQQVLSPAEMQIYELIRDRALASLMQDARGENIVVDLHAGEECIFQASMRAITEKGFLQVYSGLQYRDLLNPCPLSSLAQGKELRCQQIVPGHDGGFPAEYYTIESLAADWGDFGLMLDSVSVSMLQYVMEKDYVAFQADGSLRCRENTFKLYAVMKRAFPTMIGIHLSAYFKQTLDEVVTGRKTLPFALKQFDQTMMMRGEVLVKISLPQQLKKRIRTSSSIIKTPAEQLAGKTPGPGPQPLPAESETAPVRASAVAEGVGAVPPEPPPTVVQTTAALPPQAEVEPTLPAAAMQTAPEIAPQPVAPVVAETVVPAVPPVEPEPTGEVQEPVEAAFEPEDVGEALEAEPAKPVETDEERKEWARVFAEASGSSEEVAVQETEQVLEGHGKECPDCGRPLLLKEDRFGKYWYCSGHPECRHSQSYEKEAGLAMLCPLCGAGNVISKHTPTGKIFYVCPEKNCEFMAWSKPHDVSCQVCDSPFLVEKKDVSGRILLRCPRAGCNYMQPLSGGTGTAAAPSSATPQKRKVRVRRVAKGGVAPAGGATRKVRVVRRKA